MRKKWWLWFLGFILLLPMGLAFGLNEYLFSEGLANYYKGGKEVLLPCLAGLTHFWCKKQSKVVDFINGRFYFAG